MQGETCGICGGDGRIANSFGNQTRCPACHGTGRPSEDGGFRDVTKTKPSHHNPGLNKKAEKPTQPTTFDGQALAKEVAESSVVSNETKTKLTQEIMAYEASHGGCTKTFMRKIRKQIRPPVNA